ncbi:hypothetical protein QL285_076910 [Trifolium repens]|nr:hypothetical protein QL285_076910 [Trifolium repens]
MNEERSLMLFLLLRQRLNHHFERKRTNSLTTKRQICPKSSREGNAQSIVGVEREAIERASSLALAEEDEESSPETDTTRKKEYSGGQIATVGQ